MFRNNSGQVWVETVVYTLIALIMIGAVLAYVKPKIEELQDKAIIDQSVEVLETVNNIILEIEDIPGNQRLLDLGVKKGEFRIDSENDRILFEIESNYEYSEPGQDYNKGKMIIHTEKKGKLNIVTLTYDYSGKYNITYGGEKELKAITKSPTPYEILISNRGKTDPLVNIKNIDFGVNVK